MIQWWETQSDFQQVMFIIAAAGTIVLLVFLLLMIFGVGGDESFDGEVDTDADIDDVANDEPVGALGGLRILTIRGAFTFLAIGGWTAYGFADLVHPLLAIFFGVLFGFIAAFLLALVFRAFPKLENKGNLDYKNAIGKSGSVYIKVPKNHNGTGKVNLTFQEHYVEVDAVTDDQEDLTTGMAITVLRLENESTVIVTKLSDEQKTTKIKGEQK